jgi:hypothetical protein
MPSTPPPPPPPPSPSPAYFFLRFFLFLCMICMGSSKSKSAQEVILEKKHTKKTKRHLPIYVGVFFPPSAPLGYR